MPRPTGRAPRRSRARALCGVWFAIALSLCAVSSKAQSFPATVALAELDGRDGIAISGLESFDLAGYSVRGVGDVNGDGRADFAISAPQAGPLFAGEVYLFFGRAERPADYRVEQLDGTLGAVFAGSEAGESAGVSVAPAGDFNDDGFDDFLVGAPFGSPSGRASAGRAYLVFGRSAYPPRVELGALGSEGVTLSGGAAFDQAGHAVAGGGDFDGDGLPDLVVGSHRADFGATNAGAATVVYGTAAPPTEIDLGALAPGQGSRLVGEAEEDEAGFSVSLGADVDGDGVDDVAVGAFRADPAGRSKGGKGYVVFGGPARPAELALGDSATSVTLLGAAENDEAGFAVSLPGDFDGDGFGEVAIAAPAASPNFVFVAGAAYLVYGSPDLPATLELAALDGVAGFRISGLDVRDQLGECLDAAGDLNGDGRRDLVVGAILGDPEGVFEAGEAYALLGAPFGDADFGLETLDGANGFRLDGAERGDQAGFGCGAAGDVDGDGLDDLLIGAPTADGGGTASGIAYLVYGRRAIEATVDGVCPGDVELAATGLLPGERGSIVVGSMPGRSSVPAGECAGTELDVADPQLVGSITADATGGIGVSRTVGDPFCGALVQIVEAGSCRTSAPVSVPGLGS